jgi:hypothetical protein
MKMQKKGLIAIVLLSVIAITSVYAVMVTSRILSSGVKLKSMGIGIYADSDCTTALSSIGWGILELNEVKNYTFYIRNEGNSPITLNMTVSNWNPQSAVLYVILTWDREKYPLPCNQVVKAILSLSIIKDTPDSLTFDIVISGTG